MSNSETSQEKYENGFSDGYASGIAEAARVTVDRNRIIDWINENRTFIEFDAGDGIYRDHFNSESLIAFIDSAK